MTSKKDEIITRVADIQLNDIERLMRIIVVPASKSWYRSRKITERDL